MPPRLIGALAAVAIVAPLSLIPFDTTSAATPAATSDPQPLRGGGLGGWDGGRACQLGGAAIADCVPAISRQRSITHSWTRNTLSCPVARPFVRVREHGSRGDGWDLAHEGRQGDPKADVVEVRGAASDARGRVVGSPSSVTISVVSATWKFGRLEQEYRFAIGCSSVPG